MALARCLNCNGETESKLGKREGSTVEGAAVLCVGHSKEFEGKLRWTRARSVEMCFDCATTADAEKDIGGNIEMGLCMCTTAPLNVRESRGRGRRG